MKNHKHYEDEITERHTVTILFADGNTVTTGINGTRESITAYYVGKFFNFGTDGDKMAKAISVRFLGE